MTTQSTNHNSSKKAKSKYLDTSSTIAIIIAFIPFLFYISDIFPEGKIWETSFFTYQSKYYESVHVFIWVLMGKFIPLILLTLWYFTCKHWWHKVILIPIILYSFQIISIITDDLELNKTDEIYYLLPCLVFILCVTYTIRVKIFDKIHNIDLTELNYIDKSKWWQRNKN
ncbi:hypothetical protein ACFSTE_19465 [Aquimarina hainanensis]|uniref:Uncharacterized protein n=1 Tax=Aquimarina hainanensis TaxID=1578017 RepID=A0ABW5NF27_9FLAO|nr:hypothetical protein [Aquimarina sp. TRL1]QKX06499.1 hypothetical protein HN014_16780 [Aquimarina sp. TRL1]